MAIHARVSVQQLLEAVFSILGASASRVRILLRTRCNRAWPSASTLRGNSRHSDLTRLRSPEFAQSEPVSRTMIIGNIASRVCSGSHKGLPSSDARTDTVARPGNDREQSNMASVSADVAGFALGGNRPVAVSVAGHPARRIPVD